MPRGNPGFPDSYGVRDRAIGLLAGLALPVFYSMGGCGREAPPRPPEAVEAPQAAPEGIRLIMFNDNPSSGRPYLLAIGAKGGRIAHADLDGDGEGSWVTDIKGGLGRLQLYSTDESGAIVPDKALPMGTEYADFFGGRHPSPEERSIISAPADAVRMSAVKVSGRWLHHISFADGSGVSVVGSRLILRRGGDTLSMEGDGVNENTLRWDPYCGGQR